MITEEQEKQGLMQQEDLTLPSPTEAGDEGRDSVTIPDQLSWAKMEHKIRKMITDWEWEIMETKKRRKIRKLDVDEDMLRSSGKMLADEVLIAVRVIDENIRKEQPLFVEYLTQSRRLAIFDCTSIPNLKAEPLEIAFTKGMTYSGFLRNIIKTVDGAQTHGWDSVEILYDGSKPLKCGVEHIGHENLLFSKDSKDIQAQEFILRGFDVTVVQLRRFVKKHGFDEKQVGLIINDLTNRTDNPKNVRIYKYFTKIEDAVFTGWCAITKDNDNIGNLTAWLKAPEPLDLGRRKLVQNTITVPKTELILDANGQPQPVQILVPQTTSQWVPEVESHYPIKIFLYSESEEQCISEQKGRVFYDLPFQEAQVALRSSYINQAVRTSNLYASVDNPSSTGGPIKKLDISLEAGCMYSEKINFFHPNNPDPQMLIAADRMDVRKAQEMGMSASAVINREDSRKTAEELKQAKGEQQQMGSIPILFFSNFMREVLSISWYIVQSQAVQGQILLVPAQPGATQNDMILIGQTYDIKPAGDTDVLRRAEKIERRMMLLPIIQPTAAYPVFLMDLITELLPEDAEKYNSILRMGIQDQQQTMIAMAEMLKQAVTDDAGNIEPEFQPFAQQLQQMFAMIPQQVAAQQQGAAKQPSQPTPPNAKPNSNNAQQSPNPGAARPNI